MICRLLGHRRWYDARACVRCGAPPTPRTISRTQARQRVIHRRLGRMTTPENTDPEVKP